MGAIGVSISTRAPLVLHASFGAKKVQYELQRTVIARGRKHLSGGQN